MTALNRSIAALICLIAAFASGDARADACSDFGTKPSGSYVGTDPEAPKQIYLYTQSFFDLATAEYKEAAFISTVQEVRELMRKRNPALIDPKQSSYTLRAERAQWAFVLTNRLEKASVRNRVTLYFEPCYFNFGLASPYLELDPVAAPALANGHQLLLPKLVILRSDVIVRSPGELTSGKATLFAGLPPASEEVVCRRAEPAIAQCLGRVLLFVNADATDIQLLSLEFLGTHSTARRYDATAVAHENTQALLDAGVGTTDWALVMLAGRRKATANNHAVKYCDFRAINYRGLQFAREITLEGNTFTGVYAAPSGARPKKKLEVDVHTDRQACLSGAVATSCGKIGEDGRLEKKDRFFGFDAKPTLLEIFGKGVGMNWGTGLAQQSAGRGDGPTQIVGNEFRNLVEGIVAGGLTEGSLIEGNVFDTMLDHAIYFAGAHVVGTQIRANRFLRTLSSALKFSAHSIRARADDSGEPNFNLDEGGAPRIDPAIESNFGMRGGSITGNFFDENGEGGIFLVGSGVTVAANVFGDSPGSGWYRRWIWPHIQNTTFGGGLNTAICGWFNHARRNAFQGNSRAEGGSAKVELVLGRDPRAQGTDHTTGGDWKSGCEKYAKAPFQLRDDREYSDVTVSGSHQKVWITDLKSSRFGPAGVSVSGGANETVRCTPGSNFYACSGRTGD